MKKKDKVDPNSQEIGTAGSEQVFEMPGKSDKFLLAFRKPKR